MSLKGTGAVAIWHNLVPEAKPEFYQWHAREHMPERMAIPGFLRGRRYSAVKSAVTGAPEYFNLYEADSLSTVGGADYLNRLNNPTAWTRKVVAEFREVARSTCDVVLSCGQGDGGYIQTLCLPVCSDACAAALTATVLPEIAQHSGISAVHFLITDIAIATIETREKAARANGTLVPTHIILIEGVSQDHVATAAVAVLAAIGQSADTVSQASYVLEHATERHV